MSNLNKLTTADIGDFAKSTAVVAVITQSVISFLIDANLPIRSQLILGGIYELVKFSAPVFIFGILFSTTRTHPNSTLKDYSAFIDSRWHFLFVPTIWWTLIYLVFLPQLQQHHHYHNWQSFCWQFINGNAAPHLWYNTMMLQFIIIMPVFWWLARFTRHHKFRGLLIFVGTLVFEISWYFNYKVHVFHSPELAHWYFIDRLFPSFLIFAVSGTLLWIFRHQLMPFFSKSWLLQVIIYIILTYLVTYNFLNYHYPVKLANAPYYLPSMLFYNLSIIGLITTFFTHLKRIDSQWLALIHWIATYAYRSYLGHIFWLYWCFKLLRSIVPTLTPLVELPFLIFLTVILSFTFSYLLHQLWTKIKSTISL